MNSSVISTTTTAAYSIASTAIPSLGSHVTSLQSVLSSAELAFQTATATTELKSLSKQIMLVSLTLLLKSDELVLATLTNSQTLASATVAYYLDKTNLNSVQLANGFYNGERPNLAYNLSMGIIFAVLLLFNLGSYWYKQWWFTTSFVFATALEVLGYVGRTLSHYDVEAMDPFLLQFICLTIAPVFTMAGIYYQLLKLSKIYGEHYSRLKPLLYSYIFITCDVVSLIIQAAGGGMAGILVLQNESTDDGTHIFVGGLALQVLSMSIFAALWFDFLYKIYIKARKDAKLTDRQLDELYNPEFAHIRNIKGFKYFNLLITCAVLLIYARCVYRVCELAEGWTGFLISHESYFIALDGVMVSLATLIFVPFCPGFMFDGRKTSIPVKTLGKKKKLDLPEEEEQQQQEDDETGSLEYFEKPSAY